MKMIIRLPLDLAILDVKMPVVNGFGLCNEIRVDDKIKICFLTGLPMSIMKFLKKGVSSH